jgi:hypothetical protein
LKLPKELQDNQKGNKKAIPLVPKRYDCPICKVSPRWTPTNAPNVFMGKCPQCGMEFTYTNGNIIGGIKVLVS